MVFLDLFYTLKQLKVPVSITEWMTLMEALSQGHAKSSLTNFYFMARAVLIKSEAYYDQYDQAFGHVFQNCELPASIKDDILSWLEDPINRLELPEEELEKLKRYDLDKLREELEKRLKEQTERHDGGGKWIGTGGTSPFGHSGSHPAGGAHRRAGRGRPRHPDRCRAPLPQLPPRSHPGRAPDQGGPKAAAAVRP